MTTCSVEGCDSPKDARGLCNAHYKRLRLYGDPLVPDQRYSKYDGCRVEGCTNKHRAKGLCSTHYKHRLRPGDPQPRRRDPRVRRQPTVSDEARLEDLEWMAETGESMAGAARRLNLTEGAVERFLERVDRLDLRATLARRNPARIANDDDLKARRVAAWHESRRRKREAAA